jgi:hypothetical protein
MRKQIISVAAAFLLSVVAAGQCRAQQAEGVMEVNVPFAFQVGNQTLPAGEYRMQRLSADMRGIELIRQSDGHKTLMATTLPVEQKDGKLSPRLIFYRYGNEYFLNEIWADGAQGQRLHKSRREKELASTIGRTEVAVLAQAAADGL